MKKLASLLLVLVMITSCFSAMAVDIIIDDGDILGATYVAHQLMTAESVVNDTTKYVFTPNPTYRAILISVANLAEDATDAEIVMHVSDLKSDAEAVRTFANTVYAKISEEKIIPDATATANKFEDLANGYYLIVETELGTTSNNAIDTYSLVMLDTAGNTESINVTTKESVPSVDKKVKETNDTAGESSWGETADYDIDDEIEYEITGTVSSQYDYYKSYDYIFTDTMSKGLTLDKSSVKVTIDAVDVTSLFSITSSVDTTTDETKLVVSANLKTVETDASINIRGSSTIVVTYKATLNDKAVSGAAGNLNKVVLTYENNPTSDGTGEPTATTPEDTNIVFTYDAIVNKTDDLDNKLEGAGFTLYKLTNGEPEASWVQIGEEVKGDKMTTFTFKGLDDGKYKLVESTVPAGYNKAADIYFEIVATRDEETEALTGLTVTVTDEEGTVLSTDENPIFTVDMTEGEVTTDVINKTGTTLPSTGGMGTTLLYVGGGILVLAAIVLLIVKRRTTAE